MDTAGAQQSLHLLGRFLNHLARIVDLNHQLNESLIGAVEAPCQDCRNVQEHSWVLQQSSRVGYVKLRSCQSAHICRVRLIEERGNFAKNRTGVSDPGDLDALLSDGDDTLSENQQ